MANLIKRAFGRFINCVDRNTGRPYTDWRAEYYGCNGIIKLGESEHKYSGKREAFNELEASLGVFDPEAKTLVRIEFRKL